MARGVLVPHTLPDGRVVQVPDWIANPGGGLAMPEVAPPPPGPDQRTAQLGQQGGTAGILSQMSPDFRQLSDASAAPQAPGSMILANPLAPEIEQDAEKRAKAHEQGRGTELAKKALGQAKPGLKKVAPPDPRKRSSVIADTAETLYGRKPTGTGKPNPDNLSLVAAEQKIERQGGRDLLPEYKWKYGIEERPDLGEELDPDADQPTWGNDDPIMRARTTGVEKGMAAAKASALKYGQQQIEAERANHVANLRALDEEAHAIDNNLVAIAERRKKIADLQGVADQRAQEARSIEPRSASQVWESKGPVAQVSGILAMALGGYVQGLGRTGGKNPAWEMISKVIDDEVQNDLRKAERADASASKAQTAFQNALTLYGDPDAAALDMKLRRISNTQGMIAQQAGIKGLDQNAQARLAQMGAAAENAYLETAQKLYDQIAGSVVKSEVTLKPKGEVEKAARAAGGGGGGGAAGRGAGAPYGMSPKDFAELTKENRKLAIKLPNGRFKFVRDPTVRAEVQDRLNATTDMINTLRQVQAWRGQKWNTAMWTEKKGQIQAATSRLLELSKRKDMLGALDKGLLDFAEKKFGTPEEFTFGSGGEIDGKLSQQITMLENEQRGIIERDLDDTPLDLTEGGISAEGIEK